MSPTSNAELWYEYREAFREFTRRACAVQLLKETANPARTVIDDALMELELARLHYNHSRDSLAIALLPNSNLALAQPHDYAGHVRELAELLWNFGERREGQADENWYRAEKIVRSAATAKRSPEFTAA